VEFGIFVVLALPAFDIDPEIIRSGSCRLWSPLRSDLPGLLLAAAHEGRPRLLDLTFGRQILGNCWLCRASVIPKWARGATQRARFDYHKIVHETPCRVLRMME